MWIKGILSFRYELWHILYELWYNKYEYNVHTYDESET